MTPLPIFLAALLAAFEPASAETPASDAMIERFVAALPASTQPGAHDRSAELEMLAALNPGRIDEIRPILEAEAACEAPLRAELSDRLMRGVARGLGDEKLERLALFYEGDDFRRMGELAERGGAEPGLSESEQAEFDRILAAYPVLEFARRMHESSTAMFEDPAMEAIIRCGFERREALERLGLRLYPEVEE